ncbi:hypothetical protein TQH59_07875 [Acinetobacter johnsonii]|uniref:hypothetical protein n=1 Tax=Acinetobacter johnsonii TaxID=40214 RepID=UPI002FDB5E92|nr:hypothetical protein TQH59_07755 [Acinetobacter johnsonii]WQN48805.1 hypothetical protein TQH59_07815 [Acinetobacter johnsonii]WQN48817.1 hypothetical protein TQH59_07875 [Acinetobacter johnsonii]
MKNIAFLLLFFLLVSGHSNANAVGGSIGGWRITSNVAQGIGAKITATKDVIINGASKAVTSSATVLPKAANVGKFMSKNLGAAAVIGAMDLLLDGVDYVMDPANNTLTYKDKNHTPPPEHPSTKYIYSHSGLPGQKFSSLTTVATAFASYASNDGVNSSVTLKSCDAVNSCFFKIVRLSGAEVDNYKVSFTRTNNPSYDPSAVDDSGQKTIPIVGGSSAIADRIVEKAEEDIRAGNPASPAVAATRAVAQDMIQEAEADDVKARPIAQQLEKNPEYPSDNDAEGEITKPEVIDPVTGEVVKPAETSSIAMQFPEACDWFPQACLFIDWVMTDPNVDSDMEVPEKEIEKQEIKKDLVKISGRSCPTDVKFDVDGLPFGIKINKAYSMQEICNTVEPLKYVFELITAVICALILLRV